MNMTQPQYSLVSMDQEKIDLLKRTICKGATNDELELFIHACNRTQLDPFCRQIYAIKRKSKDQFGNWIETMTVQTGIDGYRLIAERTGKYMPGRECTFAYKDDKVFSATGYVKKLAPDGEWHEIAHTVYWSEYCPLNREGQPTGMWRDKPHVMLGKCAEACVLRKAFPADLSGVYTKEEMEQADLDAIPFTETKEEHNTLNLPITADQAQEIENNIHESDSQYRSDLLKFFGAKINYAGNGSPLPDFTMLTRKYHSACLNSTLKKKAERERSNERAI